MSKPTLQQHLDALAERIRKSWADDLPVEACGYVSDGDTTHYIADSGGYDDPHKDTRPEFIRRDLEGWKQAK